MYSSIAAVVLSSLAITSAAALPQGPIINEANIVTATPVSTITTTSEPVFTSLHFVCLYKCPSGRTSLQGDDGICHC